jgi:hypothetical protein
MAGELTFSEGMLRDYKNGIQTSYAVDDVFEMRGFGDRVVAELGRPFFQLQEETNYFAQQYLETAEAFVVPVSGYKAAERKFRATPATSGWRLYNLTGQLMRMNTVSGWLTDYPFRVASLEGMRRAALLTTQLRSRALPVEQIPAELLTAQMVDPYSNQPFQWSADEKSVVFQGLEVGHRARQPYLY